MEKLVQSKSNSNLFFLYGNEDFLKYIVENLADLEYEVPEINDVECHNGKRFFIVLTSKQLLPIFRHFAYSSFQDDKDED